MARCVKKLGLVVTTFLVCLLGTLLPAASAAADITQPEEFYGNITINGVAAPVGTVIVAKISGVERGTFTTTEAGKYGGSGTFDPRLVVSGEGADTGKTITFWVNGSQADQTAIYEPGESKELNLIAWVYPLQSTDIQITRALNYLSQAQDPDGKIGGFSVDAWVVMAIAAAGQDPDTWTAGGNSIVDYLRDNAGVNLDANKATDWERSILAIVAAGKNPRSFGGINYVDTLLAFYDGTQIGDDTLLNDDFWGILALVAIGESQTIIQASKDFIISNQNSDDGWGWTVGGDSDADNTAAAVSALIAAGVSPSSQTISNALNYLKSQQQNNGGFVSEGVTNSAVDAWVINAIADAGQSPVEDEWKESGNNPIGHLLSLQDTAGFFNYTASVESQPVWMTAYAVIALMGKSWPKDTTSPTISNLTPSSGTTVRTTSPTISASYSDAVSGINTATATIRVDSTNRTSSGTVTASSISYAASGLTVGTHSVTVTVSDKAGNEATRSWVFQVDTGGGGGGGGGGGSGGGFDQVEASLFGETTEIDIDSDGVIQEAVEATSEDGNLTIIIEEGTVALDEVGEPLETLEVEVDESPPAPPANTQVIGLAYDFGPDRATFDPPLTLTFEYEESEIPDDANEDDLVIAYWDEEAEEWVELDCTVDPVTNTITAEVSHFTVFAIIASQPSTPPSSPPALAPAAFSVSTLTVQPAEAKPKEPVTISISVANTGGTEGSYTVVLEINGLREAVQSVMVTAGRSEIVTFSVTRDEVGTYSVVVEDLNASFTVVAPLSQPPTAALPAPPAPPVTTPTNWPLIGGIIVGVIVVGLLVFLLVRRAYYY